MREGASPIGVMFNTDRMSGDGLREFAKRIEFIGIEKEKEYFEIAERRISVASPLEEFMK